MALHIVRSLGQAFDVCHKMNPKPKKKKDENDAEEGSAEKPVGTEEEVAKSPDGWKQFDLDTSMEQLSVEPKDGLGDLSTELGFDPFAAPVSGRTLGNGVDPFQPLNPLAVGNSTSLPDFPEGVDPATVHIPPAHMHLLTAPASQGQVCDRLFYLYS